jgi:hypothetical protein
MVHGPRGECMGVHPPMKISDRNKVMLLSIVIFLALAIYIALVSFNDDEGETSSDSTRADESSSAQAAEHAVLNLTVSVDGQGPQAPSVQPNSVQKVAAELAKPDAGNQSSKIESIPVLPRPAPKFAVPKVKVKDLGLKKSPVPGLVHDVFVGKNGRCFPISLAPNQRRFSKAVARERNGSSSPLKSPYAGPDPHAPHTSLCPSSMIPKTCMPPVEHSGIESGGSGKRVPAVTNDEYRSLAAAPMRSSQYPWPSQPWLSQTARWASTATNRLHIPSLCSHQSAG